MTRALILINSDQTLNVQITDNGGIVLGRDAEEIKTGGHPTLTFLTSSEFEQIVAKWIEQKSETIERLAKTSKWIRQRQEKKKEQARIK